LSSLPLPCVHRCCALTPHPHLPHPRAVQSTASKNLLLQQTIKSILSCLKEEARLNAEAAIAAAEVGSQEQRRRDTGGSSGPCSPTGCAPHLRSNIFREQQHRPDSRLHHEVIRVEAGQEQQQLDDQLPGDAVGQLEARVVHLAGELAAARQALAAALHAALPAELRPGCSITAAPAAGLAAGPRCCCCGGSTCKDGRTSRGSSPSSHHRQQHQQRSGSRCCAAVSEAPAATPMSSALDDGVAAFVLFCVQRLRGKAAASGTSSSSGGGAADMGGAAAAAAAGEQLARLLLEQLHSYSRAKLACYQGLSVAAVVGGEVGGLEQEQDQQQQQQSASQLEAWPGDTSAGGARSPSPALAAAATGGGGRSSSPLLGGASRADRERLLQAVLSDVRPWGRSPPDLLCRRSPSPALGVKADVVLGGPSRG
jgi:hypothetical protein